MNILVLKIMFQLTFVENKELEENMKLFIKNGYRNINLGNSFFFFKF